MLVESVYARDLAEDAVGELFALYSRMLGSLGFDVYGAEDRAKGFVCEALDLEPNELDAILDGELEVDDE